MTLIARITQQIAEQPPGQWFVVTDAEQKDMHRLQITVHQAAVKNNLRMTTRKTQSGLIACRLMSDEEIAEEWAKQSPGNAPTQRCQPTQKRCMYEARLKRTEELVKQHGPLTNQEVARLMDVSYTSATSYTRALMLRNAIERNANREWVSV